MRDKKRILFILTFLGLITLASLLFALSTGDSAYHLQDLFLYFMGQADETSQLILGQIRLPRIVVGLLAGASLGISGVLLQTFTRNPLADSSTLGINAGAGMIIAILISHLEISDPIFLTYLPFLATLGGLAAIYLTYLISHKKDEKINPVKIILSGVTLTAILSSSMITIVGKVNQAKLTYLVQWLSGKITGDNWESLIIVLPFFILLWCLAYSRAYSLNILSLSEESSIALGLDLKKERLVTLLLASSLVALSLSIAGNIAFVGMLASHISKRILPNDHRLTLPASMLIGIILFTLADTFTRTWLVGTSIPTGITISIIGAPYFLYLLYKNQQKY